jgi:hypothetical protein
MDTSEEETVKDEDMKEMILPCILMAFLLLRTIT